MQTREIKILIPQDIFVSLNQNENELGDQMRLMLAVKLYQNEKLTLGKAAELARISKFEFETLLSTHQIPISLLTEKDIMDDLNKMRE
jgi:predicted HTH domain antitoxin